MRARLQPGQFFRNSDVQGCRMRIKSARSIDKAELVIALDREEHSRRPRSRLVAALRKRIAELDGGAT